MLPILYQSHDLILYSYPLLMGLGWGIAYQVFFSLIPSDVSRARAQSLFWGLFLFAWIGAKLLFYFTYPKGESSAFVTEMSFWTGGGFVFYGGMIGGFIYLCLFRLFDKKFNFDLVWPMIPALSIGHGIGRIGCFLAGCCYGKPTEWFWGIFLHNHYRHPTQLLEAVGLLLLGIYLLKSKASKQILVAEYFVIYGALRLGVEFLRGDEIRGSWGPLTPSQWISLVLLMNGLLIMSKNKLLKRS